MTEATWQAGLLSLIVYVPSRARKIQTGVILQMGKLRLSLAKGRSALGSEPCKLVLPVSL